MLIFLLGSAINCLNIDYRLGQVQRSRFDSLAEGKGNDAEFEAGVWCIVAHGNDQY